MQHISSTVAYWVQWNVCNPLTHVLAQTYLSVGLFRFGLFLEEIKTKNFSLSLSLARECDKVVIVVHLPDGVIGVNFSLSSCVGDTLLLLLLLCGDDSADTAFPCESIVRTEASVAAVARGAPQKFKSNLLPVKRTSRSRRASRSLSKCNWMEKRRKKNKRNDLLEKSINTCIFHAHENSNAWTVCMKS